MHPYTVQLVLVLVLVLFLAPVPAPAPALVPVPVLVLVLVLGPRLRAIATAVEQSQLAQLPSNIWLLPNSADELLD